VDDHQSRKEIADSDAPQDRGPAHLVPVEAQQAVVDQTEDHQDQRSLGDVHVEGLAAGALCQPPADGKGKQHTDQEQE
jgi:hypothetical protein